MQPRAISGNRSRFSLPHAAPFRTIRKFAAPMPAHWCGRDTPSRASTNSALWGFEGAQPDDYVAGIGAAIGDSRSKDRRSVAGNVFAAVARRSEVADGRRPSSRLRTAITAARIATTSKPSRARLPPALRPRRLPARQAPRPRTPRTRCVIWRPCLTTGSPQSSVAPGAFASGTLASGAQAAPSQADPLDAFLSGLAPGDASQGTSPNIGAADPDNNLTFPASSPAHPVLEDMSHAAPTGVAPITLPAAQNPTSDTGDGLKWLFDNSNQTQAPVQQAAPPAPAYQSCSAGGAANAAADGFGGRQIISR